MERAKTENTGFSNATLKRLLTAGLHPMVPIPTDTVPRGSLRTPLKCVLFDIYGTLLISGSGAVGISRKSIRAFQGVQKLPGRFGRSISAEEALASFFKEIDNTHHRARQNGIDFPEVRIERIWAEVLGINDMARARRFALEFELMANPVWPMPHLETLLAACRQAEIPMGIISNAQFYTLLLLEWFLKGNLPDRGFQETLLFFSYQSGVAKPSLRLFEQAALKLEESHITPDAVLYLGNDVRKDILPAKRIGFQTALFAGDARSLREGEDCPECRDIHADLVVTDLEQLVPYIRGSAEC